MYPTPMSQLSDLKHSFIILFVKNKDFILLKQFEIHSKAEGRYSIPIYLLPLRMHSVPHY